MGKSVSGICNEASWIFRELHKQLSKSVNDPNIVAIENLGPG